jgi:hypothetical protein
MRPWFSLTVLSLALSFVSTRTAVAQTATTVIASPSCLADWWCARFRPPLGLYVRTVEEDGRYIVLEDGSVWEVEISDRASAASWVADDFVGVKQISAPRGDYEYLLTRTGFVDQKAAVRLAGRRPPAFQAHEPPEEQ